MKKFRFDLLDGVPLIKISENHNYIFDTGSPVSFSDSGYILIDGKAHTTQCEFASANTDYLRMQFNNCNITGLVGMDLIEKYIWEIDYEKSTFNIISKYDIVNSTPNSYIHYECISTIPVISITSLISHSILRFILDTGTKYSYGIEIVCKSLNFGSTVTDFNPVYGNLSLVECKEFKYQFCDIDLMHSIYYNSKVSTLLDAYGLSGILGFDFIKQFKFILNPHNKMIVVL